jgi:ABC-type branched-subunit amino acid transport system substrate-binding protein
MSGEDMWRGEDAFEGADLAVHILNRSVDEGRPPFQLITLDDEGDASHATELVTQLAANEDTVGIVYAGPPEGLPPAERALTLAGIPAILCYGDLYSARLLRPHLFQVSPPYLWQARTIARYLVRDRRYEGIGLLTEHGSLDGRLAAAVIPDAVRSAGSARITKVAYEVGTQPGWEQLADGVVRRLRRARVQSIVAQGNPTLFADLHMALRRMTTTRWDPQVVGLDLAVSPTMPRAAGGTVGADSYARGAHYLPIPSFERFRAAFTDWWDGDEPLGWELRAFDAASMIGWAAKKTRSGADVAAALEGLKGARFGGLDVTFGPDDHTAIDQTTIGLWVRPRSAFTDLIPTSDLPWLPLARGFSIDGDRTSILNRDWKFLFRNPPPPDGPAPRVGRMRYAVTSPRSDPVH